jgi:hypothetical protein
MFLARRDSLTANPTELYAVLKTQDAWCSTLYLEAFIVFLNDMAIFPVSTTLTNLQYKEKKLGM